jgi:hypothetical protein
MKSTNNLCVRNQQTNKQTNKHQWFRFYDAHDVWHLLSAIGLLLATLSLFHTDYHEASKPGMDALIAAQSRSDFYRPIE